MAFNSDGDIPLISGIFGFVAGAALILVGEHTVMLVMAVEIGWQQECGPDILMSKVQVIDVARQAT